MTQEPKIYTGRYGAWAECECGWQSSQYKNAQIATYWWAEHLARCPSRTGTPPRAVQARTADSDANRAKPVSADVQTERAQNGLNRAISATNLRQRITETREAGERLDKLDYIGRMWLATYAANVDVIGDCLEELLDQGIESVAPYATLFARMAEKTRMAAYPGSDPTMGGE